MAERELTSSEIRTLRWMKTREVANALGVSPRTVLKLASSSDASGRVRLASHWYGTGERKHRRFLIDDVERFKLSRDEQVEAELSSASEPAVKPMKANPLWA